MDDTLKASRTVGSESDNYSSIIKVRLGEGGRGIDRAKYQLRCISVRSSFGGVGGLQTIAVFLELLTLLV